MARHLRACPMRSSNSKPSCYAATGGDGVMAQVLAAVPIHGLDAVLVAVELAMEAGKPSGEHVLNVLARLKSNTASANLGDALAAELKQGWPLQLREEPLANVERYDDLRSPGPSAPASEVSS